MKIRFLLHDVYGQGGGVVTVTFALAEELAKTHDVELLVSAFGRGPSVHRLPAGVRVVSLAERESRGGPVQGRLRTWASSRPSRVVPEAEPRYCAVQPVHGLRAAALPAVAGRRRARDHAARAQPRARPVRARHPWCAWLRTTAPSWAGRARSSRATRSTPGSLDAFLTLTKADAQKYRKVLGREVTIRAIGNGTPAYEGPQSDQTSRTVVAAGRLSRTKGFDILIDSWRHVADAAPRLEARDLGGGRAAPRAHPPDRRPRPHGSSSS